MIRNKELHPFFLIHFSYFDFVYALFLFLDQNIYYLYTLLIFVF